MCIIKNATAIAMIAGQISQDAATLSGMKVFATNDLGDIMARLERSIDSQMRQLQALRMSSNFSDDIAETAYFNGEE